MHSATTRVRLVQPIQIKALRDGKTMDEALALNQRNESLRLRRPRPPTPTDDRQAPALHSQPGAPATLPRQPRQHPLLQRLRQQQHHTGSSSPAPPPPPPPPPTAAARTGQQQRLTPAPQQRLQPTTLRLQLKH